MKRWERGILASQPPSTLPAPGSSSASPSALFTRLSMLRTGLGFAPRRAASADLAGEYPGALGTFGMPVPDEDEDAPVPERSEYIIPLDPDNPEANDRLARAYAEEARLQRALRAAGLL